MLKSYPTNTFLLYFTVWCKANHGNVEMNVSYLKHEKETSSPWWNTMPGERVFLLNPCNKHLEIDHLYPRFTDEKPEAQRSPLTLEWSLSVS